MIYSQEVADINFAEPFVPIQQVGLSHSKGTNMYKSNHWIVCTRNRFFFCFVFFLAGWWMSFYSSQERIQVQREQLYMSYFWGPFLKGRGAALKTRLEDSFCLHQLASTDAGLGGCFSGFLKGLLGDYLIKPIVYKWSFCCNEHGLILILSCNWFCSNEMFSGRSVTSSLSVKLSTT